MIRGLALTVSFLLAGAVSAAAQAHPRSHPQTYPHDSSAHLPLDSAQHAALHALLHGSWEGTLSSPHGVSAGLHMSVLHDSLRNMILRMSTDQPIRAGAATDFTLKGDTVQWTQDLSGRPCKASAVVSAATPLVPELMKGKMACGDREIVFTLHKNAG